MASRIISTRKDKADLSEYFGSLKDNPLLDALEEDSKWIRAKAIARPFNLAIS